MIFYEGSEHIPYYNRLYSNLIRFEAVCCVFGWIIVIIFMCKLWKVSAVHVNFRIMFSVIALQYGIATSVRLLSKLFTALVHDPKWLVDIVLLLANILHVWAINLCIMTVLFIACERIWATLYSEGYEHRGSRIACTLLTIELIIGFIISISYEVHKQNEPSIKCKTCSIYEAVPIIHLHAWIISSVFCVLGCIIISLLHWYNKRQKKGFSSALSSRFQFQENILATQTLMPIVYGYIIVECLGLPTASLIPQLLTKLQSDDIRIQIVLQICYILVDWYNYISILVVMIVFRPIRIALSHDIHDFLCTNDVTSHRSSSAFEYHSREEQAQHEMELHFKQLCLSWEACRLSRLASKKY